MKRSIVALGLVGLLASCASLKEEVRGVVPDSSTASLNYGLSNSDKSVYPECADLDAYSGDSYRICDVDGDGKIDQVRVNGGSSNCLLGYYTSTSGKGVLYKNCTISDPAWAVLQRVFDKKNTHSCPPDTKYRKCV
ncbi:hypothetical protein J4216_01000 [Candidatus Woesearchaeota archaeon]|nr:hypothetical protein [Candidatus Woesearchaeota archaeon]